MELDSSLGRLASVEFCGPEGLASSDSAKAPATDKLSRSTEARDWLAVLGLAMRQEKVEGD